MILAQTALAGSHPLFFGGWAQIERVFILATLGFLSLVVLLRSSGKRTLSKMNVFDFVFVVAIGSLLSATITSSDQTLSSWLVALATLILLQVVLSSLAAHSKLADRFINGEPELMLVKGVFCDDRMRRQRITREEVRAAIRDKGVARVEDVDAVVLETDGTLTVVWTQETSGEATSLADPLAAEDRHGSGDAR